MFVVNQCDKADNGQAGSDDHHRINLAPDHNGTIDHRSANHDHHDNRPTHHAPTADHHSVCCSSSDLLADLRRRQLLPSRRVLLERRPWHFGDGRKRELNRVCQQQRVALGASVISIFYRLFSPATPSRATLSLGRSSSLR